MRGKWGDFDEEKVLLNINIKICRAVNVSRRKIFKYVDLSMSVEENIEICKAVNVNRRQILTYFHCFL